MNKRTTAQFLRKYGLFFLLPVLLFIPGIEGFAFPQNESMFSDIAISHYPNAIFLKRSILEYQTIPLWSEAILGGFPFATNPLSGLWYPPGWLALIFPLPLGFNILTAIHVVFGGLGMALFLRKQGLADFSAGLGGLAFSLMPKYFAHFGAGHLSLGYAIPWTSWLLLAASAKSRKRYAQPGLLVGVIFLADVRWAAYAGLLWLAWEMYQRKSIWMTWAKNITAQIGLAALISAPQAIPLLEFLRLSTRANLETGDVLTYSLPPARLFGLIFPDLGGFHEFALYAGGMVLILSLVSILSKAMRKRVKFWLVLLLITWIYAMGENIPGLEVLAQLPGFSLLRVPPRILFLGGLSLSVLAAFGADYLLGGIQDNEEVKPIRLGLSATMTFVILVFLGIWWLTQEIEINYLLGVGFLSLSFIFIMLRLAARIDLKIWKAGVLLILALDLFLVNQAAFEYRSVDAVLSEGKMAANYLANQSGEFRIYSASYSIPQQTAAYNGLNLADGVDPMQRENYVAYMDRASGVPRTGYSVTVPSYESDDLSLVNQAYIPDAQLLGAIGVKYIVTEFDLPFEEVARFDESRIYQIEAADPNFVVAKNQVHFSTSASEISLPALSYPGWQASVDGERAEIDLSDPLFGVVELGDGEHEVILKFRPLSVYLGIGLALIGALLLFLWQWRQKHDH